MVNLDRLVPVQAVLKNCLFSLFWGIKEGEKSYFGPASWFCVILEMVPFPTVSRGCY